MKILIIEDNSVSRKAMKAALQEDGFFVSEANDGELAMAMVRQEAFDMVVCDMRLPDMDGFELIAAIKTVLPQTIPTLCITAYYYMERREILRAGFDDFLVKPFSMADLVSMCRILLGGRSDH